MPTHLRLLASMTAAVFAALTGITAVNAADCGSYSCNASLKAVRELASDDAITGVAWNPTGTVLVTLGRNGQHLILWDPSKGRQLHSLVRNTVIANFDSVAFSPKGNYVFVPPVITPKTKMVAFDLWNVKTGEIDGSVLNDLLSDGNRAEAYAVSKEGSIVAIKNGLHSVTVFDARNWKVIGHVTIPNPKFPSFPETPQTLALSPDGTLLAVGYYDGSVELFDTKSLSLIRTIHAYADMVVNKIAFSPDGRLFVTGPFRPLDSATDFINSLRIFRVSDGSLVRSFPGDFQFVDGLAWSPDGRLIAAITEHRYLYLWDATLGARAAGPVTLKYAAWIAEFRPDGKVLAAAAYNAVTLFDVAEAARKGEGHADNR